MKVSIIFLSFLAILVARSSGLLNSNNNEAPDGRFAYEYRILEHLLEHKDMLVEQADQIRELQEQRMRNAKGSAVYIRWGRTSCPVESGTENIYVGYGAGSYYTHTGAAANHLCVPREPTGDRYDDTQTSGAYMYGMEYEVSSNKFFDQSLHQQDVPCVVCLSRRPVLLMIPGRNNCTDDSWTLEYSGYLFAGHASHAAATEYICVDGEPEKDAAGQANTNGRLIYPVEARCGYALPCPPYVKGREVSCVVCTKK